MRLIYFDESKYDPKSSPYFYLGGILVSDKHVNQLESSLSQIQYNFFGTQTLSKAAEFHGSDLFQGSGSCKGKKLVDRMKIYESVISCLENNAVETQIIQINVTSHRKKYIYPEPEYRLGFMLFLERVCDYLDKTNDLGVVFGDYESNEISRSILDFSQFKFKGTTTMFYGRPLGRIVDTIHFSHSHYSRFLQAADLMLYLCQRYESGKTPTKHHDVALMKLWEGYKAKKLTRIQNWP